MDKVLLIDKPAGWTSFDVVAKIRGQITRQITEDPNICGCDACQQELRRREQGEERKRPHRLKVGHAGTLDPFATGLLIVLVGKATKQQNEFMGLDKTYEFTVRLGQNSSTGDPDGEITEVSDNEPSRKDLEAAIEQFTGEITQVPPIYSAIKVGGQRAYKLAHEGKEPEMPSRKVTIHSFDLINYNYPIIELEATVSKGTYIRTLASDIGGALGTGAYCSQLRRLKIGEYSVPQAYSIESAIEAIFEG